MVFQSKEELFHDIPTKKAVHNSQGYPKTGESFIKFYYEEALPDADTAATGKIPYSVKEKNEYQRYCQDYFPGCLRKKIDKWLDKKAPIVEFPKAGYEKILMGMDTEKFDVFHSDYLKSIKDDMGSGVGMLYRYKNAHRGVFKRGQKELAKSLWTLFLFIALIVFDVPYRLVFKPLEAIWQMVMPLLSLTPDTRIFFLPLEVVNIPLILTMLIFWIFSVWLALTHMDGLPKKGMCEWVPIAAIYVNPFYLLMRATIGADFFTGVREIYEAIVANMPKGTFMVVITVLNVIVYRLFVTTALFICYTGSLLYGLPIYLYREIRLKKKKEEQEEKEVVTDIRRQWDFYLEFRKELRDADRQLKFMDMWNQAAGKKGHFPGWFDINEYVRRTENALLKENRVRIQEVEKEEREKMKGQDSMREKLMAQVANLKNQEEEMAKKSQITDMDERNRAMVSFASLMKDGGEGDLNSMFAQLATMLGYQDIPSSSPRSETWPAAKEYASGLSAEKSGRFDRFTKDDYEKAAWQGNIPALARLANLYELDYDINSELAYGEDIGLQQWTHPLEREAKEARLVMGLTPDSSLYALLRQAGNGKGDFDCEVLYNLALRCKKDNSLKREFKEALLVFVSTAARRQAERKDSESPRAAYYLAMLNYHCLDDKEGARVWAEISAEKEYGPALYFLFDNQKELGLERKEGDGYCYEAWSAGYPPARVCKIWDHQREESRKENQRQINKAQSEAAFERRQQEKKAMMEAYEKKLREREKVFNAFVYDSYTDDDGTYIAGKMSMKEYLDSGLYRDDKMRDYEKKVDKELS